MIRLITCKVGCFFLFYFKYKAESFPVDIAFVSPWSCLMLSDSLKCLSQCFIGPCLCCHVAGGRFNGEA